MAITSATASAGPTSTSVDTSFDAFYRRQAPALIRFFSRNVGDPQDAADLTAEAFAVAYQSMSRRDRLGVDEGAWLFGISKKLLLKYRRSGRVALAARRRIGLERIELDDESLARVEELADVEDLRRRVRGALGSLSPRVANALVLRVVLELPYVDVARILSCSEGAARARVSRGLGALAAQLKEAPR